MNEFIRKLKKLRHPRQAMRDLKKRLKKIFQRGQSVMILPNYDCNYNCSYCIRTVMEIEHTPPAKTLDEWQKFLLDLDGVFKEGKSKIREIVLSGGEPTILPYFIDLSNWILKQGWELGNDLSVNGRSWIQEGGLGKGGESKNVSSSTRSSDESTTRKRSTKRTVQRQNNMFKRF